MTDDYILVPMILDAMVLNQATSVATPFLRFQMQYENLGSFESPEPAPFGGDPFPQPTAGVYLHWTLPRALRQGSHDTENGTTTFQYAPNRWLVARVQSGVSPATAVKAWIIESDYTDPSAGTSPYIDPNSADGAPTPTQIGRALRFNSSLNNLPPPPATPFLTAVGPGSVYFSTFSPGVQNVFSFYDNVTADDDSTPIDQATFSYYVVGWYADPSHDPLQGTTWQPNPDTSLPGTFENDTFDWYVYAASAAIPMQMLVHTLVSSVPWDRNAENPPAANYPENIGQTVQVSVGHTAVDALSAMVRLDRSSQTEADLLEAFQYGLLDQFNQPGSVEAMNMAIREHWFGAAPNGTLWTVVAAQQTGSTALPTPPTPPLTPAQKQALAALNVGQFELDRQQRILESMQWNLFGLWWKYNWNNDNSPSVDSGQADQLNYQLPLQIGMGETCTYPGGNDPSKEVWYYCKVQAQLNLVQELSNAANALQTALQILLNPVTQEIKAADRPQYRSPNDPVLLVTGLGRSNNLDPDGSLLCRVPSQTIDALSIGGTAYCVDNSCGNNVQSQVPVLNDPHALLPVGIQQYQTESFFLSPALFTQVLPGGATPANITAVQTAIAAIPAPTPGAAVLAPLPTAMATWTQPWTPLLLNWQVTFLNTPTYTGANGQPFWEFQQQNWQFTGTDYQWIGPTSGAGNFDEATSGMVLSGRTFITPHLAFTLADQLDEYVQTHQLRDPALELLLQDLDKFVDGIAAQDVLSQRLSGLLAMMVGRQYTSNVAPPTTLQALLGDYHHGYPMPSGDSYASFGPPIWDFAPLCGTFFVINQLTVIDTFGRTVDLMLANYSTDPGNDRKDEEFYFYPIAGRDMQAPTAVAPAPNLPESTGPTQRMVQLSPRLLEQSLLNVRLTTNDGQNNDIHLVPDANPICGWIVPNHLDRSLALYAPDGTAWGEVYLSEQESGSGFVPSWQPDPTNSGAPQSVGAIPNSYVANMLQTLMARTDNGAGFSDFLQVIDESLWTIDPRGARTDQNLSVLIGRPLAIMQAQVSLQMRGTPCYNQDWWNTFVPSEAPSTQSPATLGTLDAGILGSQWPVRIGSQTLRSDGVIGYYLEDPSNIANSFRVFNTVNPPLGVQTDYLQQIGANNSNYLQVSVIDDTTAVPDPTQNQVCNLTLLVDPRGSIHAFSGLLPVVDLTIPSEFVTPALQKMAYLFRSGPFLTAPDVVRIPRPAERKGTWSWFDNVLATTTSLSPADGKVHLSTTSPLIKEGWLKFVPDLPDLKQK